MIANQPPNQPLPLAPNSVFLLSMSYLPPPDVISPLEAALPTHQPRVPGISTRAMPFKLRVYTVFRRLSVTDPRLIAAVAPSVPLHAGWPLRIKLAAWPMP